MTRLFAATLRRTLASLVGAAALAAAPVSAQVQSVDPDKAIDGDLAHPAAPGVQPAPVAPPPAVASADGTPVTETGGAEQSAAKASADPTAAAAKDETYKEDDLIGAAEGVFGKGAKGLADFIKDLLKKQGEPNGYIVGREGGAALGIGVRYGSGTLFHKIEGKRPVYWTGPSIGFDAGANAGNTFVLVYNLHNTQDLYKRYPAGEGQAYFVGGFNASYMRRDDVVLIPVRMGVGLRLGINAGYMKFSEKQQWLPF